MFKSIFSAVAITTATVAFLAAWLNAQPDPKANYYLAGAIVIVYGTDHYTRDHRVCAIASACLTGIFCFLWATHQDVANVNFALSGAFICVLTLFYSLTCLARGQKERPFEDD